MSGMERDPAMPEGAPIMAYIALRALGGDGLPPEPGPRTKSGRLRAKGWRILPIPRFWPAATLTNDGRGGGNPAMISFHIVDDCLVIPPEDLDFKARKFRGRRPAIQWAWSIAFEGGQP